MFLIKLDFSPCRRYRVNWMAIDLPQTSSFPSSSFSSLFYDDGAIAKNLWKSSSREFSVLGLPDVSISEIYPPPFLRARRQLFVFDEKAGSHYPC